MAGETFFVRSRGKMTGPYDVAGLRRLAKLGMLSCVHEVSTDKQTWSSAASVPGVLSEAAAPPPPPAVSPPVSQPSVGNGPMGACGTCGRVVEAALLLDDHGQFICPSCYQRMVPSRPSTAPSRVSRTGEGGYFGSGVASLILGIAGIIIPAAGPLCLFLANIVSRDMTVVFWGILLVGLACAISATVFASVTIRGNKRAKARDGNGLATTGLVLGIVSLSGYAMWFVYLAVIFVAMALRAAHHAH